MSRIIFYSIIFDDHVMDDGGGENDAPTRGGFFLSLFLIRVSFLFYSKYIE